MTPTKAVVFLALLSVSIADAFEWPALPTLDTAALTTEIGAKLAAPVIDNYAKLQTAYNGIQTQYAAVGPLLETAGTQGPEIIADFEKLATTIQSVINDPAKAKEVLFIPTLASEAFPITEKLSKLLNQAKPLNIEGLNDLATSLDSVKTTLGLVRCPAVPAECVKALTGGLFGK